jgi:hypothetical protein
MADSLTFNMTVVTVPSSTRTQVTGRFDKRQYLALQNTGAGSVSFTFLSSAGPTSAGAGISLDPTTASSGAQGGVWEWIDTVPQNAIYAYSAAGTTVVIVQG